MSCSYTTAQTYADFLTAFVAISKLANELNIAVYLRMLPGRPCDSLFFTSTFVDSVNAAAGFGNVYIAASSGLMLSQVGQSQ